MFQRRRRPDAIWNDQQIVSEQWVIGSTAPDPNDQRPWHSYADWKEANGYYKYLW